MDINDHESDDDDDPSDSRTNTFTRMPMTASSPVMTEKSTETTKSYPKNGLTKQALLSIPVNQHTGRPPGSYPGVSVTSTREPTSFTTPEPDRESAIVSESSNLMSSYSRTPLPTTPVNDHGGHRPDRPWPPKHSNNAPIYAAAAIIPIFVLAIIGAVFCIVLRRRKQRGENNGTAPTREMKQSKHTALPYLATPASTQSHNMSSRVPSTSPPSQLRPVILGPILSNSNGAYMTGMDTSDVVSVVSNNPRSTDQHTDNNSLMEPPPPYRPSSIAPPSFVSTSRQSSLRVQHHPPTTSRTHLIERIQFTDTFDDVSDFSGPTRGQSDDLASAVSDMSYQHDPVVTRSTL